MLLLPDRRNRVCLYGPGENDPHRHRAGRRDPLAVCLEIQQVLPVLQMRPDAAAGMEFLSRLDEARAVKGGFAQVLVKPLDPVRLAEVLAREQSGL